MNLMELRIDCAVKQKKGLHIILASVVIWVAVLLVQLSSFPILTKNLLVFCCTTPLLPISYFLSFIIKADFQNKENPLSKLGILFSVNQILYLLIAMWIYPTIPEKMLMIIAMIFGAHLMPYSWLYISKAYLVLSVIIPLLILLIGINFEAYVIAVVMVGIEILFSMLLIFENKKLKG